MVGTLKGFWKARLSGIMKKAWSLFKSGIVSFSLALKISWQINKGNITNSKVKQLLRK